MTQTSPVLQLGSKLCGLDPTWHRPTTSRLPVLLAPERPLGPALLGRCLRGRGRPKGTQQGLALGWGEALPSILPVGAGEQASSPEEP